MSDLIGMLQLFLNALNPVLILMIVLSLVISLAHGMVNIYRNI